MLAQPVEAGIRDNDTRFFWVDGGIREVSRVTQRTLGDRLEERRLANVGETDLESRTLLLVSVLRDEFTLWKCREERKKRQEKIKKKKKRDEIVCAWERWE